MRRRLGNFLNCGGRSLYNTKVENIFVLTTELQKFLIIVFCGFHSVGIESISIQNYIFTTPNPIKSFSY